MSYPKTKTSFINGLPIEFQYRTVSVELYRVVDGALKVHLRGFFAVTLDALKRFAL